MTKLLLKEIYNNFGEFEKYCAIYGIDSKLGYKTPKKAWDANPEYVVKINEDSKRVEVKRVLESKMIQFYVNDFKIKAPASSCFFSSLGGADKETCFLRVCFHSENIFPYIEFTISMKENKYVIERLSGYRLTYGLTEFRKTRVKNVLQIFDKINKFMAENENKIDYGPRFKIDYGPRLDENKSE